MQQRSDIETVVDDAAKRCKALAKTLGGNVKVIDHLLINSDMVTYDCPFSNYLGVNWNKKIIYISKIARISDISGMIHEMGHVFASDKPPNSSEEFVFFGWEYAAAKSVGLLKLWSKGTKDYVIPQEALSRIAPRGTTWGDLNSIVKSIVIKERLEFAVKNKMVSKDFKPLTIR